MPEIVVNDPGKAQPTIAARIKKWRIPAIAYTIALLVVVGLLFRLGNENFLSSYNLNTLEFFLGS